MKQNTHTQILIVEDDLTVARDLEDRLVQQGYSVVGLATEKYTAVEMADRYSPDVFFIDIALAGPSTGIETALAIRGRHQNPIVFLTSCVDEAQVNPSRQLEPYGYLLKPVQDQELSVTIELALHQANEDPISSPDFEHLENILQYRDIVHKSTAGYFRVGTNGKLVTANQAWLEMHGYDSISDIADLQFSQTLANGSQKAGIHLLQKLLSGKQVSGLKMSRRLRDGSIGHHLLSAGPCRQFGRLDGFEGFIIDYSGINDRENQENLTRKYECMRVYTCGIAHRFNSQLQSIIGNSELALMDLPSNSKVRENLKEINSITRQAADMIRQLMHYSGSGAFSPKPMNLNHIFQELMAREKGLIPSNIAVTTQLSKDIPSIKADERQIQVAILCLLENAIEAQEDTDGAIIISTWSEFCRPDDLNNTYCSKDLPAGEYVILEISDSGPGILPENIDKVFDPFFSTKFSGRGLGLASVWGTVREHQGFIQLRTKPGHGTTFLLFFPGLDDTTG